jgi:hypothetical protein
MATRIKTPPERLYDRDFYLWSQRQAELLQARRFDELDLDNLIEEVRDLGASLYRSIYSRVRNIIEHLLKLEHSPAIEPRLGWRRTIRAQRSDLGRDLTPTLRRMIIDELAVAYDQARKDATATMRDHGEGAAAESLPETCPYAFEQITGDWMP